ncbi:DUF262 domain-containing protein [Candidatus Zixiibacteriota bacterium]
MERVEYEKEIIQDILNYHKNGELNVTPWYQRRSVWLKPQKAYLINTLFENKPIPSLYIRHSLDLDAEKSIREVVDGQQRIRAILEFVSDEFAARHPEHKNVVKYSDLSRPEIQKFKMTSISVGYLLGATDSDVIEIFGRLNSVAKTLNPQEKRNAQYSGEYKQFCLKEAASRIELWRSLGIFTANEIARMYEIQFISDIVLNLINGLSDYSSAKLNTIYSKYDEDFPEQNAIRKRIERIFSQIAILDQTCIKDTVFSRQPLFFSLCLILDSCDRNLPTKKIKSAIFAIDEIFSADLSSSALGPSDIEFQKACSASTQRIKSRRIRDGYIKKALGL